PGASGEPRIRQRAGDTIAKRIEVTMSHNLASCGLAGIDDRGLRQVLSAISQIAEVAQECTSHSSSVPNIRCAIYFASRVAKAATRTDLPGARASATGSCHAQRYPTRPEPCRPSPPHSDRTSLR